MLIRAGVALIAVAASLTFAAAPARAAAGNTNMTPVATLWAECLDIGSNAPGTPVGLFGCNRAALSQEWWWNCSQPNSMCLVSSPSSGYSQCWDLRSYATGSYVILNYCNSSLASQRWTISANKIVSAGSNGRMCLDLRSYDARTLVGLNACSDGLASQRWFWRTTS
ncbi:RICIN domain-containing protein [Dactylosporangium sp. McL0621]|uniref:RICIN domain-containing protein n=1 Tax=Dactylosporangium sp. McL0621 TaxID=3415678 RepID=UPI003CF5A958